MSYDKVINILRATFEWSEFCAPAPNATEVQLQTDSPNAVAETLNRYVFATVAAGIPWDVKPEDGYEWACRQSFAINQKYWELNSQIALGQTHELPVDTIGEAGNPTIWWDYQNKLRNRLGEKLCSQEEFDRRRLFAANVPVEWTRGTDPVIWQLAVREGYMPVGMEGFDPAYLQTNPKLKDVRGLTALQWLQNLQGMSHYNKPMWKPGGEPNPDYPGPK